MDGTPNETQQFMSHYKKETVVVKIKTVKIQITFKTLCGH